MRKRHLGRGAEPDPGRTHPRHIMVNSIADALRQIEAAGGKVLTPRTDIGANMGAFAAFADPVGNEFGLYEEPGPGT
ncbi:MAG TPA: VOC family protein [Rhodanobacteraceae bacterium]